MVSEQDLRSKISGSKMSHRKVLSNPEHLFSYTSRNHGSDDRLKCPLVVEFSEFSGQLNIVEFLDWLIEVERFFEDRNIAKKKQVKFVCRKLKGSAWAWWEQLQRMRTRLGKDPIQHWEKMKKYLKRQFLPPDYQDLVYQEYLNCKQSGNSIAVYTKRFYRLQSYLDFNESEEYRISRYKKGLCWAISESLSSRSFYCLSDLVLAAEAIEQLVEIEKTRKWKPHSLQRTSTDDVRYPVVIATQKQSSTLCNPTENALTQSYKVSGGQREYNSIIQSKRKGADFFDVIKEEDLVSRQPEEEQQQDSAVTTDCIMSSNVCFNGIHDKVGDDIFVKKEYCLNQIEEAGGIFLPKKIKSNAAISTSVITDQLQEVKNDFESTEEMMKIPTPMCTIQHEIKLIFGPSLHNLSGNGAKHIQILQDKANNCLLGTSIVTENICICVLPVLLVLNEYQISKKYLENQTLRITCKARFHIKCQDYMLGILCRSWIQSTMNFNGQNQQSSMQARIQLHSMFTRRDYQHQPEPVHLLAKESSTETIVRRYGSLCGHVKKSATAKNHKNWRASNLFPNMKNRYPKTYIPKESEWKTAFMSTAEFCEFLVMCGKHSFITSTLWTDERRKLCVSLNRYYKMLDTLPSIQDLLKMAISSSDFTKSPLYKFCHQTNQILLCQSESLFHMKLRNGRINLFVLPAFPTHKDNRNWKLCIGNPAIKILVSSRIVTPYLDYNLGMSPVYLTANWNCPFHQINSEQKAPQVDCKKCHFMGDAANYPGFILHPNDIMAKEQNITFIHDLTRLSNIHQDQNYQGLGWFHIPFTKSRSSMFTPFFYCIRKGKIRPTEELRVKNKHFTALELVQKYVMHLHIHSGLSTGVVGTFPLKAGEHNKIQERSSCREQGPRVTRKDIGKCKGKISNPTYKRLSKTIEDLHQNPLRNHCISNFFYICHLYYYLTENEDHSRTSSLEEGAPDVGQIKAQALILDEAEAAHCRSPFNA